MEGARLINIDKKPLRAFYRIYILPMHIAKRDGEAKKAMEEELANWKAYVKAEGLQDQLKEYISDQKARQQAYDDVQKVKGELAALRGTDLNRMPVAELAKHADELKKVAQKVEDATKLFTAQRTAFTTKWH